MNKNRATVIAETFPDLFGFPDTDITKIIFDCENGWFDLIFEMCKCIASRALKEGIDPKSENYPRINMITANHASDGRMYVSIQSEDALVIMDYHDEIIDSFKYQSESVCEVCGKPGRAIEIWQSVYDGIQYVRCANHEDINAEM
jgi:hypothetical protein